MLVQIWTDVTQLQVLLRMPVIRFELCMSELLAFDAGTWARGGWKIWAIGNLFSGAQ